MNKPPLPECDISCAVDHLVRSSSLLSLRLHTVNVKKCMRVGKGSERPRKIGISQAPYTSTFQELFWMTPSCSIHIPFS